jgi:NtrC-family two-component system sensor histidine kinase KinB
MVDRLRKYAEMQVDKLVLEQQKSEAILFSMGDGILMTDNQGKIQLANRKALEFLNKTKYSEVGEKRLEDILPDESEFRKAVLEVSENPHENGIKEIDLSTDDRRMFLRVSAHRLLSPASKKELGVLTAIQDVTLVKELDSMKEEFLLSIP